MMTHWKYWKYYNYNIVILLYPTAFWNIKQISFVDILQKKNYAITILNLVFFFYCSLKFIIFLNKKKFKNWGVKINILDKELNIKLSKFTMLGVHKL